MLMKGRPRCARVRSSTSVPLVAALACLPLLVAASPSANCEEATPSDLTGLSVEDLMSVEVTIASKKSQRLFDVPATVYVVTQEDLRRSGATSIAEALRLAPGVEVARIDASKWAVSIRGDNNRFANKLLVLMDGRTLFTPTFAGVFWDVQDYPLEDIERIEVIRGPGASVWGANAVNGVINIITKSAQDTQGNLAVLESGNVEQGLATYRYGGKTGGGDSYRVYAKYARRDELTHLTGGEATDDWWLGQAGFRLDREKPGGRRFMLQGNANEGKAGATEVFPALSPPYTQTLDFYRPMSGTNLLARWERSPSEEVERSLQLYYDRTHRDDPLAEEWRETFDLDYHSRQALGTRQDVNWGLCYRYTSHRTRGSDVLWFTPPDEKDGIYSAYLQDDVTLNPEMTLTLGSRIEHNDLTGLEVQPTARLRWQPNVTRTVWASVSRAIRTPSRVDRSVNVNYFVAGVDSTTGLPIMVRPVGNQGFDSEELLAYELGCRFQPSPRLSFDLSAFSNHYDNFTSYETGTPFLNPSVPPYLVQPLVLDNLLNVRMRGVEVSGNLKASDRWRLALGYTWLEPYYAYDPQTTSTRPLEPWDPVHQFHLRSFLDLSHHFELDALLYAVSNIKGPKVPGYLRLDLRLGWRPRKDYEASLGVQNLFHDGKQEFGTTVHEQPTLMRTSVYAKLTRRF